MTSVSFFVLGRPVPQGSKKAFIAGGRARVVEDNSKTGTWRHDVSVAAMEVMKHREPFIGPLRVEMVFRMPRPKYHYRSGANAHLLKPNAPYWCSVTPDVDKLARLVNDALTAAAAWGDDAQVVALTALKRYADPGEPIGVEVQIAHIEDDLSGEVGPSPQTSLVRVAPHQGAPVAG